MSLKDELAREHARYVAADEAVARQLAAKKAAEDAESIPYLAAFRAYVTPKVLACDAGAVETSCTIRPSNQGAVGIVFALSVPPIQLAAYSGVYGTKLRIPKRWSMHERYYVQCAECERYSKDARSLSEVFPGLIAFMQHYGCEHLRASVGQ